MQRALGKMVVGSILSSAATWYPDALAFYCSTSGRRITFGELDDRVDRLARTFLDWGLRKGDVLAFLISNRLEIVEVFFALARTGIVGLPLNYRLTGPELAELTQAMRASALVYEARFRAGARHVLDAVPAIDKVAKIDGGREDVGLDYEPLFAGGPAALPDIDIEEADPFYFNLTSGTTGAPKSYILTHYNNCTMGTFLQAVEISRRDVVLTVFPMFGRVGFGWSIGSMLYGVPNVLANFEPREVARLIEAEGVTITNLVPTMAAMLMAAQASEPRVMNSLRAIIFAGAVLPASIRERAAATLCRDIYEYYGMNEMGALTMSTPADRATRADSVGRPLTYSRLKIADNGRALGPNEIGEVLGCSPMSPTGYFEDPERSAQTFSDGWVHTGDLGYLDADGYLFLRGRKKDMIVTGGQNVYAAEVEDTILRCPGVADCAVFALPDDLWGERVTSVVVPRDGAALDEAKLDAFCRDHLAGFKIPKEFIFQGEPLPRNATGKVQKFLLVERFSRRGA
jgi:fatty-acyl-CoA synthase